MVVEVVAADAGLDTGGVALRMLALLEAGGGAE
jgi:hypothetical protein